MKHLPAPRGEKSFAGGLRGSFLLASLCSAAFALSGAAMTATPAAQPAERDGTLAVLIEDDFDAPSARTVYRLETDEGENLALDFGSGLPDRTLKSGARIHVVGRSDGETLFVERAERLSARQTLGAEQLTSWTTGPKKVLLIRFNWQNDTAQPYTDVQSNNVMFGASNSVAAFYNETSYGITTHSGNITPWLTVAANKPTTCDPFTGASMADTLAKNAGFDKTKYDLYLYVFPSLPCGWAGLGVVGGAGAWINQALSTYVVAHELGHNYGLEHAHSRDCGSTPVGPNCAENEYGDPFDTMGGNNRQFNAYSKNYLSWFPTAGTVVTQSSGTATYTLQPLESASGLRAIQIPTGGASGTYWIEFRSASSGFDAGLPANVTGGALIHVGPSADFGTDLLDMTTGTATFSDAALDVGKMFVDNVANLSIKTLSLGASTLTVQVQFAPQPPSSAFSYAPSSPLVNHGVVFQDKSTSPATSWSWDFGDGTVSTLQNPVHFYMASGARTVTMTASNGSGPFVAAADAVNVAANAARSFYTLTPCRVVDTRNAAGAYGGPALAAGATRNFTLTGRCGIPATAKGVSMNVTITNPTAAGDLRVFSVGAPDLGAKTIYFQSGQTRANNAELELGTSGNISVACEIPSGTVQFILDVDGYLQ